MNWFYIILYPSIFVLLLFIIEKTRKVKHRPTYWICLFSALLAFELIFGVIKGYATSDILNQAIIEKNCLSDGDRKKYKKKRENHKSEGDRCFNEAAYLCVFIPNLNDQEISEELFRTAVYASATGLTKSGAIGALISLLVEYSINVYKEWNRMHTLLNQAIHHYELVEFYDDVLEKA